MNSKRALVLAVVAALAASSSAEARTRVPVPAKAFTSCGSLVDYVQDHAIRIVNAGGVPGQGFFVRPDSDDKRQPALVPPAVPQVSAGEGPTFSPTNVQEQGVDEPDTVKTDGSRLFVITANKLFALSVRNGKAHLAGSLVLDGYDNEMLLAGDRLLVLSNSHGQPFMFNRARAASSPFPYFGGLTRLSEVDVSDPERMSVLRTLETDGRYVNARLHGNTARVVITSRSEPIALPRWPESRTEEIQLQRKAIRRARLSTWRPSYLLKKPATGSRMRRALVSCRAVRRPSAPSGVGLATVLTIDLTRGLRPVDSDAVFTDTDTVYASSNSLYLATERWFNEEDPPRRLPAGSYTAIHKFDISDPHRTDLRASGAVRGFALNQWSFSEHEGRLRVATTDDPWWFEPEDDQEAESFVSVLEESAGALVEAGRVGGIGRGERIYAVRFIEDKGFVVTFRQVDPLYTLDLSDPQHPTILGELKILGYSSYLHPIGENLLLGIGQDATKEGRTKGTQLSVFDVSNLRQPVRLHRRTLEQGSSEAEYDHHAFLWWPSTNLAVFPAEIYTRKKEDRFIGALGFRINRDQGIVEAGRVAHPGTHDPWPIERSIVIDDRLFTVSEVGVRVSDLQTFANVDWVRLK